MLFSPDALVWCTGLRKNWDVPETFPNSAVIKAYKDAKVDQNKDKFTYGRPDLQLLRRFCQDKFGWQQDRADELLLPVLKVSTWMSLLASFVTFVILLSTSVPPPLPHPSLSCSQQL